MKAPFNHGYYVVMSRDVEVVGPRKIGFDALGKHEAFMAGPFEELKNAAAAAAKLRAAARTAQKR